MTNFGKNVVRTVLIILFSICGIIYYYKSTHPKTKIDTTDDSVTATTTASTTATSTEVSTTTTKISTTTATTTQITNISDLIKVSAPTKNSTITSPLIVKGQARGNWFFEASFPVVLKDSDGKIITTTHAQADGDWMTTDFVPFTATVTFKMATDSQIKSGILILKKDNPSGLPENDNSVEIPIILK